MEPIDYIKLFKMDQENYEFNREEFIQELGKEFLEYCLNTTIGIDKTKGHVYYYRFREIVKTFESKFWAISELKVGIKFTKGLWNAFFATQVVTLRSELFPDIQKRIVGLKKDRSTQDNSPSDKKYQGNGKGNKRPSR